MSTVKLTEAKAQLSRLVEQASAGDTITILKHGKPVARLVPVERNRTPIDIDRLRALTNSMKKSGTSAGELLRQMRDDERY